MMKLLESKMARFAGYASSACNHARGTADRHQARRAHGVEGLPTERARVASRSHAAISGGGKM